MRIPVIAAVLAATGFCGVAKATVVTYTLQSLGGSDYAAEFTVTNDTLGIPIEEFTIYFGVGDYENLVITSSPADWDPLAIQPDPGIPDDGFADWLALSGGIAPGASLGGFAVTFTFLGIGAPGNWLFDIVDPATFDVLDSGTATLAGGIGEIPLPGALWLFGSILAGAGLSGLRKRRAKTILAKSSLP